MTNKKSKSWLIVLPIFLICLVLLVLQLTGAWFTASGSASTGDGKDLRLGSLGSLDVTAVGGVWLDSNGNKITDRDVVMPGDRLTGASLKVTYSDDGTDDAYYVVESNGKYYYFNEQSQLTEITDSCASVITLGTTIEVPSAVLKIVVDGTTYYFDGSTSSASIPNAAQGKEIGMELSNATYNVKIIQKANLTKEKAYEILTGDNLVESYYGEAKVGTLDASAGIYTNTANTNVATLEYIAVSKGDIISMGFGPVLSDGKVQYRFRVYYYDSNYNFVERTTDNQLTDYTVTKDGYVRLSVYCGTETATDEDVQHIKDTLKVIRKSESNIQKLAPLEFFYNTGKLTSTGKRALQGACSDGTYLYYTVTTNNDSDNTYVYKLDIATKTVVKTVNDHSYTHANGMTYHDGYLYINGDTVIHKINADTLAYDSTIDMSSLSTSIKDFDIISSIAYNDSIGKFVIRYKDTNLVRGIAILNENFVCEKYMPLSFDDSKTGTDIDTVGNNVLVGVFKEKTNEKYFQSYIYVTNLEGELIKKIKLCQDSYTQALELESVAVVGNTVYVFFVDDYNNYQSNSIYTVDLNKIL